MSTSKESTILTGALPAGDFPNAPHRPGELPALVEVDPNNPHWSVLEAMLVWVMSAVLLILLPTLAIVPYALYKYSGESYEAFVKSLTADKTVIFISIISVIPAHLLTLGLVWAVVTQHGKRPFWRTIGWGWSPNFGFWSSAGTALALLVAGILLINLIGGEATDLDQIINSSTAARITTAFLATATAPLVEELIYRGLIYSALQRSIDKFWTTIRAVLPSATSQAALFRAEGRLWTAGLWSIVARLSKIANSPPLPPVVQKRMGMIWAVIIVSTLFASVHVFQYSNNMGVIVAISLLSISLTLVRALTGRLLPCFVIHLIFNGLQSLYIIFEPYIKAPGTSGEQKAAAIVWMIVRTII